jgi:hypothetical protein
LDWSYFEEIEPRLSYNKDCEKIILEQGMEAAGFV